MNGALHAEAGYRALEGVLRHLAGRGSLAERLSHALPAVLKAVEFPAGLVRVLDPSNRRLYTVAHAGFPAGWHYLAAPVELGEHPCGLSSRDEAGVVIPDLTEGSQPESGWACAGYRTYVSEPLHESDHLLGCLSVASTEVIEPEPWQLELLRTLARPIAMAVACSHQRTARAAAEAARAEFETLYELAPDAIVTVGSDGRIMLLNSQAERMFGYDRDELAGQPVETLMPQRYRGGHVGHRMGYHRDPRTRPMGSGLELLALRRSGEEFPVEISLAPSGDNGHTSVIVVIRDTTERAEAERERQRLLASERQKGEQLKLAVREAHHRIKNNLQSISDLLYLELSNLEDSAAAGVVQESLERIQSIALVHDLLSQDEDVQTVDAREMLDRLVPMVLRNGGPSARDARLEIDSAVAPLSSRKATSLALLVSELVSNSGKHGLCNPHPRLRVRLQPANDGLLLLVEDNGPGLPDTFDLLRDANVGLQVVRTLAERDLNGKLSLSSGPGLRAEVWFPW